MKRIGPVKELLGRWKIWYPAGDGMFNVDVPADILTLNADGSYTWSPPGLPAVPEEGRWGVAEEREGVHKLCFDGRNGKAVCHYLLLLLQPDGAMVLHWQRTRTDAVVFDDRVMIGVQI